MLAAVTAPTAVIESDPQANHLVRFGQRYGLGVAAILTWCFLATALILVHLTSAPHPLVVALYIAAYLSGGTMASIGALTDLRHGAVNIDLLMVTAALGAAVLGAWAEGAILLGLFSSSNALEHYALARTRNAVRALMDLSPREASRLRDGVERRVPVEQLAVGDLVVVRPGEHIPADATITTGTTEVDQAAITGESMPVHKTVGNDVFAGTVNQSGAFTAQVTKLSTETALARIARLVAEAQNQKGRTERFTERFEGPYAIFVIAASIACFLVMLGLDLSVDDASYRAITLLVVASPCALVISTPAATLSAIANAARNGVLVKGGSSLDDLGAVNIVAFDKTGTLTLGKPAVTAIVASPGFPEVEVLTIAASAEHLSEHPIAHAICRAAEARNIPLRDTHAFTSDPGRGVTATIDGDVVLVGNESLFTDMGITPDSVLTAAAQNLRDDGQTAVLVGTNQAMVGVIGVADTLRPGAAEAIAHLREHGIRRIVMLTGDNDRVAQAIAEHVGITEVHANLLPEEKLAQIDALRRDGRVAMVGDGVNDAPALARADLGVGMGAGGTDVALETADVVLITGDLERLVHAVSLGKRMRTVIRACLGFALTVIAVLVLSNLVKGIPLPIGVVGHEGSTIIVVLAGLTLLGFRSSSKAVSTAPVQRLAHT